MLTVCVIAVVLAGSVATGATGLAMASHRRARELQRRLDATQANLQAARRTLRTLGQAYQAERLRRQQATREVVTTEGTN